MTFNHKGALDLLDLAEVRLKMEEQDEQEEKE